MEKRAHFLLYFEVTWVLMIFPFKFFVCAYENVWNRHHVLRKGVWSNANQPTTNYHSCCWWTNMFNEMFMLVTTHEKRHEKNVIIAVVTVIAALFISVSYSYIIIWKQRSYTKCDCRYLIWHIMNMKKPEPAGARKPTQRYQINMGGSMFHFNGQAFSIKAHSTSIATIL